jgi:hypothetical protein
MSGFGVNQELVDFRVNFLHRVINSHHVSFEPTSLWTPMNKTATAIVLLVGTVAFQASCGTARQQDCEKQLKEGIRPGTPLEIAEAALKKCDFKTTVDPAKKTLYGDKRVRGGLIVERTQVLINLDSDNRVTTVDFTKGLIGP